MKRFSWQQNTNEEELSVDITPMLDVVFILLIFFVVTASFVKESGIEVNRPQAQTTVNQEGVTILVGINSDDTIWIANRQMAINNVRPTLERLHAENPQGAVVIQADRDSRTEILVGVMDAARAAGINNVAIASVKG